MIIRGFVILVTILILANCCSKSFSEKEQEYALNLTEAVPKSFKQKPAGKLYPAQYYSREELVCTYK